MENLFWQCFALIALLALVGPFVLSVLGFFMIIPGILGGIVDIGFAIKEYNSK